MGKCQHCGKDDVVTQAMELGGRSLQVCAECCSKIQKRRAEYEERKAQADNQERKSKAEYDERKAKEATQAKK